MIRDLSDVRSREQGRRRGAQQSLQLVLWGLWTLAVVVTAYLNWHADVLADRAINMLGLVIKSGLVGVVGLVVLTLIEMRLDPRWLSE